MSDQKRKSLFDEIPRRRYTRSIKWDSLPPDSPGDTIPLWVADMDFVSPPEVVEALRERAVHGVFGYTLSDDEVGLAVTRWLEERFSWTVPAEWLMIFPGVVSALYLTVDALTRPGEGVAIMPPVYHPFFEAIEKTGRRVVANPLICRDGLYRMDLDGLKTILDGRETSLLILSSPHNPVGRVWTREELFGLAELMDSHPELYVLSDEIHSDLILPGQVHTPLAKLLDEESANRLITARSVSKTFNLAGLKTAFLIVGDSALRRKLQERLYLTGAGLPNPFGLTAAVAAYRHGGPWLDELIVYIRDNYLFLCRYLGTHLPGWRPAPLQGTYLAWVRIDDLKTLVADFVEGLRRGAGVWLEAGTTYGIEGEGWVRLNLGTSRALLAEALDRIRRFCAAG